MPLTEQQEIPKRPEQSQLWTKRNLISSVQVLNTISKAFTNPLDAILGFMIIIAGIGELIVRPASWYFWIFAVMVLVASFEEHNKIISTTESGLDKKETK